ncbi:MAG TPA: cytochrome c oxidase assembly protein [Alphaproteobacteria bacterium]|jgi:putative membrane protein|nr:cytochrome c oxidase assembly protein [Alphaproteobacteria bacterium]
MCVLAASFCLYGLRCRSGKIATDGRQFLIGCAGLGVLAAAFVTPLCNLSVALFAARSVQHVLMLLVAAPLLVIGLPRGRVGRWESRVAPIGFGVVLWCWHLPRFYDATLQNNVIYWAMHITLFGVSLSLWRVILSERGIAASLFTGVQMSALGALLTLSPRPWFSVYAATTWPWGLSPAADQQLGGAIMWIVGGVLLSGFTIMALARLFADPGSGRRSSFASTSWG